MIRIICWICLTVVAVLLTECEANRRPSSIRADLKALIKFARLDINFFVDTCVSSGEFERVLLQLFPAIEILILKRDDHTHVQTSGKSLAVVLSDRTAEETEGVVLFSTLDDVLANNGYSTTCPEFFRITDYGGNELDALKGATKTLSCAKIVCVSGNILRSHDNMPFSSDVITYMSEHGYTIYNFYENRRIRFFNLQVDMLFVKKDIMDEMFEVGFKDNLIK